jgi:hypothetical protein
MSSVDPIDRALWSIAEAGSRYSSEGAAEEQRRAWAAIEVTVTEARRHYERLRDAHSIAEARLAPALEAARAAKATRRQAPAEDEQARRQFQAALAELQTELQAAMAARAEADVARARAESERDEVTASFEAARVSRDVAIETLRRAESQRDAALAALTHAEAAVAEIAGQRDAAMTELKEYRSGPAPIIDVIEIEADEDEIVLVDAVIDEDEGRFVTALRPAPTEPPPPSRTPLDCPVCYLEVGATFGNLLPANLGRLLVTDARVVRQEGRLAAVLALPAGAEGSPTSAGEEQAERLREAGYRVEWAQAIHLAS